MGASTDLLYIVIFSWSTIAGKNSMIEYHFKP